MTAQFLTTELTNLVQESKRKNNDLRSAAEKSLHDLKGFHVTSEEQLIADIRRRAQFIQPFLIACSTSNARFAGPGIVCLQRLSVAQGLPKERLKDVLEALRECTSLGLDVQLKILQSLPSLLQNYGNELRGDLLLAILEVCSSLQAAKHPAVSGSAVATLQQLVISVFDKVSDEDEKSLEIPCATQVAVKTGSVQIRPAAYDAYRIFQDLCLIADGAQPKYAKLSVLTQASGLELIESVLTNHNTVFTTHQEQGHLLCSLVMPLVMKGLSEKSPFQTAVRSLRILQALVRNHLSILSQECEAALALLFVMLDDTVTSWRRALVLEFYRNIFSDPALMTQLYQICDQRDGGKPIIQDTLGALVRLSTEKPSVIGLGQSSTTPIAQGESQDGTAEQAAIEAGTMAGVIAGPAVSANNTGLSAQWSTVKVSCLEHLDKTEAPSLPETYLYSLVLACINNLSDSMAKFIIPLTVHSEPRQRRKKRTEEIAEADETESPAANTPAGRRRVSRTQSFKKRTVPLNPLAFENHGSSPMIKSAADLISNCWPAVLATCSTFLNSSLDNDYYRALVRSIQRFTQVAGLLRLTTPRDAFLTTLGKNAVPSNILTASLTSPKVTQSEFVGGQSNKSMLSVESIVSQATFRSSERNRNQPESPASLNARNLLCLRALLNLAIALGPTLGSAWSIIFENLQQADIILAISAGRFVRNNREASAKSKALSETTAQDVSTEASAVQAAASRLFESTVDFPNDAFVNVLQSLSRLLHNISPAVQLSGPPTPVMPGTKFNHQRRVGSISNLNGTGDSDAQDYIFALSKLGDLAAMNLHRFAHYDAADSGWDILNQELHALATKSQIPSKARCLSAEILGQIGRDVAKLSLEEDQSVRNAALNTILRALNSLAESLNLSQKQAVLDTAIESSTDVHATVLSSLRVLLEQSGEGLTDGWDLVFTTLVSVFASDTSLHADRSSGDAASLNSSEPQYAVLSKDLARSAFESVQLICSDFLGVVPLTSQTTLLDLVLRFASQEDDLNMSLTSIGCFWNVSDHLSSQTPEISFTFAKEQDQTSTASSSAAVRKKADAGSISSLWLLVLLHLNTITSSERAELRNGAVQTITRIFNSAEESLARSTWHLCISAVLFRMMADNAASQETIAANRVSADRDVSLESYNDTSKLILESVATLVGNHFDDLRQSPHFDDLWCTLISLWTSFLNIGSHSLSAAVFSAVISVFSKAEDWAEDGASAAKPVLALWTEHLPVEKRIQELAEANQEAFLAYVEALACIYPLVAPTVNEQDNAKVARNLQLIAEASLSAPYSSDVEYLTPLQKEILGFVDIARMDLVGSPTAFLGLLTEYATLPYRRAREEIAPSGPTFVALSRAAMTRVSTVFRKHSSTPEVYTSKTAHKILASLAIAIESKYKWKQEAKSAALWRVATKCALDILDPMLTHLQTSNVNKISQAEIWEVVVAVCSGIAYADIDEAASGDALVSDEEFDIAALQKLQPLIVPSLGASFVPDTLRKTYALSLFRNSLIHAPEPGEVSEDNPLFGLYKVRFGRTYEPSPSARTKMAFFCFSQLIALVAVRDSFASRIRLAMAAAPYLILRFALPIKSYIADQPLRSRMPMQESERQELLWVLEQIVELDSEPESIPAAPGVLSKHKRHLHRLHTLVVKATRIASRDEEVLEALISCIDAVGDEFGL